MTPATSILLPARSRIDSYGSFAEGRKGQALDRGKIPTPLRPYAPYAELWHEEDDIYRDQLVEAPPRLPGKI